MTSLADILAALVDIFGVPIGVLLVAGGPTFIIWVEWQMAKEERR